ncbi:transposase [Streptomyces althioticus]
MPSALEKGLRAPGPGRSRGGRTSKIHLVCDGAGRPLAFTLTGGNTNDCTQFTVVMEAIRVPRVGPACGPATCWATRATVPGSSVPGCDGGASVTPFPSGSTRSATGSDAAAAADDRQPSTSSELPPVSWSP